MNRDILNKVYNTFKHLDRDYSKSKKSRNDFILGKFGGDFNIGSMLILESISSFDGDETEEDVEKLSFIKDIFDKLKETKDFWNQLPDFSFSKESSKHDFYNKIMEAFSVGYGINVCKQSELHRKRKFSIHYNIGSKSDFSAIFPDCNVLHVFDDNIKNHVQNLLGVEVKCDSYYELCNNNSLEEVNKIMIGKLME